MLAELLLSRWNSWGPRPAFVDGEREVSYGTLARQALGWAALCDRRGWSAGDCVAVQMANQPGFASVFVGLGLRRVALLPINTAWLPEQVLRRLAGKPLAGIIGDARHLAAWAEMRTSTAVHVPLVDVQHVDADQVSGVEVLADDGDADALYLMTTGSTGLPKLVVRTQAQLLANANGVARRLQWAPECRVLPVTPFFHANGFSNGLLLPLVAGACVVLMPQFFPARLIELVRRQRVNVLLASPVVYASLARAGAARDTWASLDYGLSSGAALSPEVARQAAEQGLALRELYGSSETGTIAIAPPSTDGEPAFAPLDHVEVCILSPSGDGLAAGQTGRVAIRSPAVMKGYWTSDGIESARDGRGFHVMGDLGRVRSDGQLSLAGRVPSFVNVGGTKVSPVEVEHVLLGLPEVLRCQVTGLAHPMLGQVVAATIVVRPGRRLDLDQVLAHCRRHLAEHEIPRQISIEDQRPADFPDKHSVE